MNKQNNIFKITGFEKFKCSADKCKITCCEGWDVNVDEKTLNKLRNEENKFMYILNNLKEDTSKNEYFIDKEIHERCPFLNENGLCEIVKNHGEEYISLTCKTFPRIKNKFESRIELSLSCACPEVVEIISDINSTIEMIGEDENYTNSSLEFKIREMLIKIVNTEGLNLEYKLIICFQMLVTILENIHIQERKLYREIEGYEDIEYLKELESMYSKVNLNIYESMEEINNLFLDIVENYRSVSGLERILEEISNFAEEIEIDYLCENWRNYKKEFEKYNDLMKKTIIFKILSMSCNDIEELVVSFQLIILEYLLIRYALFLRYCIDGEKKINIQDIKNYIVAFSRVIGNNSEAVLEFITEGFENKILENGYICFISLY